MRDTMKCFTQVYERDDNVFAILMRIPQEGIKNSNIGGSLVNLPESFL